MPPPCAVAALAVAVALLSSVLLAADATATPRPRADDGAAGATVGAARGQPLRILAIMTVDTMSHHLWMAPLTVALARRGHLVQSVDVAVPKDAPPSLNVTVIETAFQIEDTMKDLFHLNFLQQMKAMYEYGANDCERDLAAPALRRLSDPAYKGTFDLIVVDFLSDCMLGFAHRFGYPGVVALSPFPGAPPLLDLKGSPLVPAVVPPTMLPYPLPMSLWQRATATAVAVYLRLLAAWIQPRFDGVLRNEFGEDVPPVEELRRRVHVALVNENPVLDAPRPYVPGLIPVGGMHVQRANHSKIPADLRSWLDAADKGFILVSFGSVFKTADMSEAKRSALLGAFQALGDVHVVWKMEPDLVPRSALPANTRLEKWLPQEDILGHPNILLFVSHCGGLSTTEAAYNGVPLLGVPVAVDQFVNVDKAVRLGMARKLPLADLTRDLLDAELQTMLQDPSYRAAARRTAALLLDQQASPLETAVWWCEYVGRHGGAPHLRSPALDVPWPQALLLDVLALFAAAVVGLLLGLALLARCLVRQVRGGSPPPRQPRQPRTGHSKAE